MHNVYDAKQYKHFKYYLANIDGLSIDCVK